jgi:hypothetical protein
MKRKRKRASSPSITNTELIYYSDWKSLPLNECQRLVALLKSKESTYTEYADDHLQVQGLRLQLQEVRDEKRELTSRVETLKTDALLADIECKRLRALQNEHKQEVRRLTEIHRVQLQEEKEEHKRQATVAISGLLQRGAFPDTVAGQLDYHQRSLVITYRKLAKQPREAPVFPEYRFCTIDDTRCKVETDESEEGDDSKPTYHETCAFQSYGPAIQIVLRSNDACAMEVGEQSYHVDKRTMQQTNGATHRIRKMDLHSVVLPTDGVFYRITKKLLRALDTVDTITHVVDVRAQTMSLGFLQNMQHLKYSLAVWHGSRKCAPDVILRQGFQPLASNNGLMGRGIYGSTSWTYSREYAYKPEADWSCCSALNRKAEFPYSTQICQQGCRGLWLCLAVFDYLTENDTEEFVEHGDDCRTVLDGSWARIPDGMNVVMRDASKICPLFWVGFRVPQ